MITLSLNLNLLNQGEKIILIKDAVVPFLSVFLGALLAYKYNLALDNKRKSEETAAKMRIICSKSDFLLGSLMSYNEFLIEVVETKFLNNDIDAPSNPIFIPDTSCFNVNIDSYSFLSNYNIRFLYVVEQLNRQLQLLTACAQTYQNQTTLNAKKIAQGIYQKNDTINTQNSLQTLRNSLDSAIEFAYILNCQLNKCCIKYFNYLYFETFQDTNFIKEFYKKYMQLIDTTEIVKNENNVFESCWIYPLNFPSTIALTWRKIKFNFRFLCSYFLIDKLWTNKGKKNNESRNS